MIVDRLEHRPAGDRVERSARLRWVGGEFRLRISVPPEFAPPEADASAFLAVALPLAMYRSEDLYVDGEVSPRLLRNSEEIQAVYAAWDPEVRRCRVRVAAEANLPPTAAGVACTISRGIDSLYSATREHDPALTQLVFCDTLEPIQDERVKAEERRLAAEAAELIGLPLLTLSTNLRDPAARMLDYTLMHGAGLAFIFLSLAGGLRRAVVPSGITYAVMTAVGSHPLLDPLFSTETLEIEFHGMRDGRPGKVRSLVGERPELLPYVKVCFTENRADNCGRCRKCLRTMLCLQAAGALERATSFPDEIDLELIRETRLNDVQQLGLWMETADILGDTDQNRELQAAIHHMLRRSVRPSLAEWADTFSEWVRGRRQSPDPRWSTSDAQYRHSSNHMSSMLRRGRPYPYGPQAARPQPEPAWSVGPLPADWAPPPDPPKGVIGLLRVIDPLARRHRYAAGELPATEGAQLVGELGALLSEPAESTIPVWLTEDGLLLTERYAADPPRPGLARTLRWVLAPLRWRGAPPVAARLRELGARTITAAAAARPAPGRGPTTAPVGYLAQRNSDPPARGAGGRLPLFSSLNPVTGDQLLSTSEREGRELGYAGTQQLGYLEPAAPVSGRLGAGRPVIPWASRFGQGVSG